MITNNLSQPGRLVPYYIKAIAMVIPAIMLGFQISGGSFFSPARCKANCDFRHLYTAGFMVAGSYFVYFSTSRGGVDAGERLLRRLLGLGFFKFQIALPFALLFLVWRRCDWLESCTFRNSSFGRFLFSGAPKSNARFANSLLSVSVRETSVDQMKFNLNPS